MRCIAVRWRKHAIWNTALVPSLYDDIHLLGSTIVFGLDYCRSRQENGITFLIDAPSSAIQQANECSAKCQSIANFFFFKKKKESSIYMQSSHPAAFSYSFHLLLGVTSWLIAGLRCAFSRFYLSGEKQIPHCTWCYEIALNKWQSLPLIKAGKCPFMSSATSKLKGKKICTYLPLFRSPGSLPARLPACLWKATTCWHLLSLEMGAEEHGHECITPRVYLPKSRIRFAHQDFHRGLRPTI